jgi:hypothetical protein
MNSMCKQVMCVLALILFFILCAPAQKAAAQDDVYATYDEFYVDLANFGQWIDDPQYGYVWSPDVDGSFRPYYTNGYWVMTEYGNTWISDYPWGWAAFHYGRWTYDNYYGWLWIPGSQWAPSWVSWRYGDGFYGWAPMGPGYQVGSNFYCPDDWWVFIQPQYLYSGNYYRYWYGPRNNEHILPNTNYVNNTYTRNTYTYPTGPRQKEVESISRQPVQVYHLARSRNLNTRVHNGVVKMYHPTEVRSGGANGQRATPPNLVAAPQPVRSPQAVKTGATATGQAPTPTFRANLPKNNGRTDQPGANINPTAEPQPQQPRYNENPYEYDVNRPVPQPARQDPPPRQQPAPQPQRQQQAPQQQPVRQQPQAPAQQPARQQPAPQPAQQQPAPAPAPRQGGRR